MKKNHKCIIEKTMRGVGGPTSLCPLSYPVTILYHIINYETLEPQSGTELYISFMFQKYYLKL